jgi:hypothetical protein
MKHHVVVPKIIYPSSFTGPTPRDASALRGKKQVKEQDYRVGTERGLRKSTS